MDHKSFIGSISKEELARYYDRRDLPGILHLLAHISLVAVLAGIVWFGGMFWWVALLPLGITIVFLFTLAHEATHQTPFKSLWLNEIAGHLAGLANLLPLVWFRFFHLAHHRYTNDPKHDPELAGKRPDRIPSLIWHLSGVPYWASMMRTLVSNALGLQLPDYVPTRAKRRVTFEARIYLCLYAAVCTSLFWSSAAFWLWMVPCLLGQPFLRIYLLAEHGNCAFVENMLFNTRTTFTNRAVRFLAWNMPFHIEHHTLPNVPFHALPTLHEKMLGHHGVTSKGYSGFAKEYLTLVKNHEAR